MGSSPKDEAGLVRQAHSLTADLTTPDRAIYWLDLVLTAAAAWGGLALAATTHGLATGLVAGLVGLLALYRGLSFIHEISHLRPKDVPGFRLGWNFRCAAEKLEKMFNARWERATSTAVPIPNRQTLERVRT